MSISEIKRYGQAGAENNADRELKFVELRLLDLLTGDWLGNEFNYPLHILIIDEMDNEDGPIDQKLANKIGTIRHPDVRYGPGHSQEPLLQNPKFNLNWDDVRNNPAYQPIFNKIEAACQTFQRILDEAVAAQTFKSEVTEKIKGLFQSTLHELKTKKDELQQKLEGQTKRTD